MRIPLEILQKVKPILLIDKTVTRCKFTSNNGEVFMTVKNIENKVTTYLIARYDNEVKANKISRSLDRVYRF